MDVATVATATASTANVMNLIFPFVLASTRPLRVSIEISNGGPGNVPHFVSMPREIEKGEKRDQRAVFPVGAETVTLLLLSSV